MSTWQRYFGWLVTEIDRQPHVPPADIVPGFQLEDTPAAVELEHQARHREVLRLIAAVLEEERVKPQGFRNVARYDLALEALSILLPSAPDERLLREVPPVGIRYPAPVIPGRAS